MGKVHRSHGCCYIPFGGKEHKHEHYEILINPGVYEYVPMYGVYIFMLDYKSQCING